MEKIKRIDGEISYFEKAIPATETELSNLELKETDETDEGKRDKIYLNIETLNKDLEVFKSELYINRLTTDYEKDFILSDRHIDEILIFESQKFVASETKQKEIEAAREKFLKSDSILVLDELMKSGFLNVMLSQIKQGKAVKPQNLFEDV